MKKHIRAILDGVRPRRPLHHKKWTKKAVPYADAAKCVRAGLSKAQMAWVLDVSLSAAGRLREKIRLIDKIMARGFREGLERTGGSK